jgi:hypothetical protein
MSLKKSSDTFGNRTRDLPVCSAVPQPLRHRVPPIKEELERKFNPRGSADKSIQNYTGTKYVWCHGNSRLVTREVNRWGVIVRTRLFQILLEIVNSASTDTSELCIKRVFEMDRSASTVSYMPYCIHSIYVTFYFFVVQFIDC